MVAHSPSPRLSIVVLNYNRQYDTAHTLAVLKQQICFDRNDIEIIAVDNGSEDGTADFLRTQQDWVKILLLDQNLGIEALNRGFEMASGEFIFVLDDDSHPADASIFDQIIDAFEQNQRIGIVACAIQNEEGCYVKSWHLESPEASGESVAFVGCGFAIRRHLFKRIGWFPENYFLYQNEIDVSIKVARLGYGISYLPHCRVVHRNSPTGRAHWRQVFFPTRNTIWLIRAYAPFPLAIYYLFSRICFGFVRAVQSGEYGYYVRALRQGFETDVESMTLSSDMCRRFKVLWQQNSILHHLKWALVGEKVK